jgi:putative ABC transport system permease protein
VRGLVRRLRSLGTSLVRGNAINSEMDEEFRLHIELRAEDLMRSGLTPAAAARRAHLEFGSSERYLEESREGRGLRGIDELVGDVRLAARSLWNAPTFAVAAVLTLALGVGANAAVFSMMSASLLRPLPFTDPDRLVVLYQTRLESGRGTVDYPWSYPEFAAVRSTLTTLTHVAAYYADNVNLAGVAAEPIRVRMETVSASYLPALGVEPVIGRGFLVHEDSVPGAHPVVILGHDVWSRVFGADPGIVGGSVRLNGVALTVVGVGPAGFRGLTGEAELWLPQAMAPAVSFSEQLTSMQRFHSVIGRLRPGATVEQAWAELAAAGASAAALARAESGAAAGEAEWGAALASLEQARRHPDSVRAQFILAGSAVFVLLIAAVNLAGLLLARSSVRARETAVRAALGAGRFRLVRHGLVEGGVLGVLGGLVGAVLAAWTVRVLVAYAPERMGGSRPPFADLAAFAESSIDWRVVAFALGVAVATGVLAGLIPGLRATRGDLTRALRDGSRGSSAGVGSLRRPTTLSLAAVAQVACALVLLTGAGVLLQGFHRLRSLDPGMETEGILTFRVSPPEREYRGAAAAPLLQRILERVESVPGVRSATVSLCPPLSSCSSTPLYIAGRPPTGDPPIVGRHYVAPAHFRTLGIPVLRGRDLTAADRAGSPRVAVINETAARRFWPGEDPIGRRVWFGSGGGFASADSLTEIVGVAGDVLYAAPGGVIRPDFYTSYLQFTWHYTTVMVRTTGDPLALVPALRAAVREVDPNLPIHDVRTMRQRAAEALAWERFATVTLVLFAALGLLLASVGIYGIMAYSVAQRRREIGIRVALGATSRQIVRFVITQGAVLTAAGLAIGAAASVAFIRVVPALMPHAGSGDPLVFGAVVAILLLVALLACYLPARAATGIDPVRVIAAD